MTRRGGLIAGGLAGLVVVGAGLALAARHPDAEYAVRTVTLNGQAYHLEIADTPARQQLGLGQRDSLPANHGMLFTYDQAQQLCFWMKDMRFPLDIIWLDDQRRVTYVASRLAPSSYPQTYCQAQARYVLELNAGDAARLGVKAGQQLAI